MLIPSRRPSDPGEILLEHYLNPREISISSFASLVECSRKHMSNIVHGKARIEPKLAVKIARVLGTTPRFWLNLQSAVDLYDAERIIGSWEPAEKVVSA
jgi:antitoxin HigA-1